MTKVTMKKAKLLKVKSRVRAGLSSRKPCYI